MGSDAPVPVVVIGGGPAGLMAADRVSAAGYPVTVLERMPTPGRKLMMAGRGGLNLTHSEPIDRFLDRYGPAKDAMEVWLSRFAPADLVRFAEGLGQETFVGSSGRIFPKAMKASPLLRAWLARLAMQGVRLMTRHTWTGLDDHGRVICCDANGETRAMAAQAIVLALGGASWPKLGADGSWVPIVQSWHVGVAPLAPSNAGIHIAWTSHFRDRSAGHPLKRIAIACDGQTVRGEAMITASGLEGGAVYALAPVLRARLARSAQAWISVDLRPDIDQAALTRRLAAAPQGKQSLANWLRKTASLAPEAINLLREAAHLSGDKALPAEPEGLAATIKAVVLPVTGFSGLDRVISTAGGIRLDELDENLMLRHRPGVFACGEMLDWDAPTGGYLLQACLATGSVAGCGVVAWLEKQKSILAGDRSD